MDIIKPKRKPKHYVNNRDLFDAIVIYKNKYKEAVDSGKTLPRIPEYVGQAIMHISERLATKPQFAGYPFKDEMIFDGIETCIRYFNNFNPEKTENPFAYFTQIIKNAFIQRIEKEKKELVGKHKYLHKMSFEGSMVAMQMEQEFGSSNVDLDNNYMANLVEKHDAKIAEKKKNKLNTKAKKGLEIFYED
jgi:hypothetical protein